MVSSWIDRVSRSLCGNCLLDQEHNMPGAAIPPNNTCSPPVYRTFLWCFLIIQIQHGLIVGISSDSCNVRGYYSDNESEV
jgi:hypothetical protein